MTPLGGAVGCIISASIGGYHFPSIEELRMQIRLLVVFFGLMSGLSQAQDIRGAISGTVTDPQGAQVVGAAVVVTNTGTNVSTKLTTNSSGFYEAPLLMPGPYEVTVEARGFKKSKR